MTTKTVGATARDYATITLWHAAFPGGTGTWDGVLYNDAEFLNESTFGGSSLSIGGTSTCPETLTTATGQSAFDNSTNPLTYDVSKGVGIRQTNAYTTALGLGSYVTVRGVQISQQGSGAISRALIVGFTNVAVSIDRSLLYQDVFGAGYVAYLQGPNGGGAQTMTNFVVIAANASLSGVRLLYATGSVLANGTIGSPSNLSNTQSAVLAQGGNPKITNVAMFGFTNAVNVTAGTPTGTNNATDLASIGFTSASSLTSQTYASQFTGITTTGGLDYRLKSGNTIGIVAGVGQGATDTTDIPGAIDIFGTARISGKWSIGAYQDSSGGTTYTLAATAGIYAITGQAAKLTATRKMPAVAGGYLISGVATRAAAARKLSLTSGGYAISGAAISTRLTRFLGANTGSYALNGAATATTATRKMSAVAGAYSINGAATKIGRQITLNAIAGSYIVTGAAAGLTLTHRYILQAAPGSYSIAGSGAILTSSGSGPTATSDIYPWLRRQLRR